MSRGRQPSRRPAQFLILAAAVAVSGCTTSDAPRDHAAIEALLGARGAPALGWERNGAGDALDSAWLAQPMTAELAVKAAMLKSPRLQQIYGELGLALADVAESIQISNPRIELSRLGLANGNGSQVVLGVAAPLVDLITLPAKSRLARLEFERIRFEIAAAILGVSLDVEAAWYSYIGAQQVADMRGAVAEALDASAELAERFYAAGNITELQLNIERAGASSARIEAARAKVAARLARLELNSAIGLDGSEARWASAESLPLPVTVEDDPALLQSIARTSSLDLLSAMKGKEVAESAARITRTFRLLGSTEVGYERERDPDRSVISGPTLSLELPIFNQGGARVTRADARLRIARARLAQLELASGNAVAAGAERVRVLSDIVRIYQTALVPQREIVVRQSQFEQNYALIGQFEVLQAKTLEYDAYQGFLEALRDYWLARVDLMRLIGGRLPSEKQVSEAAPSTQQILNPADPPGRDPHAGHQAPPADGIPRVGPSSAHDKHMAQQ